MTAVSDQIVREYFETQGFLVRQPQKYQVAARKKREDEEVDLLVLRPHAGEEEWPKEMLWNAARLRKVKRAVVGVCGWHTEKFSPVTLASNPELFRFAEADIVQRAGEFLGTGPIAKILCLPALTVSRSGRNKALELLRERGVNGVLLFRTMLQELSDFVETHKNYEKSDVLQMLRILKTHDLLKGPQLELFGGAAKRRSRKKKPEPPE
ncbi:MAG: hypothetical protein EOM20_18655 [Spartobacteria bacterium]|nr:hypothetical protein [Spartobacteria bacterium]